VLGEPMINRQDAISERRFMGVAPLALRNVCKVELVGK
jgi:hypothetical protein